MEAEASRAVDMNRQQSSDTSLGENLVNAPREQKPFSSVVYPKEHVPFKSHHRRGEPLVSNDDGTWWSKSELLVRGVVSGYWDVNKSKFRIAIIKL